MDRQDAMAGGEEARVLDHVRLTVAVLLAMLLVLLWWRGYGPYSSAACCAGETGTGVSTPVKTPAGAPLPPAVTIAPGAPEAPPAAVEPQAPAPEAPPAAVEPQAPAAEAPPAAGEPQAPAAEAPPVAVEPQAPVAEAPPAAVEAEAPAAEPPYTISDPNAQVRTEPVHLPPWEGWKPPSYQHDVYVPPPVESAPVAAEPEAVTPPAMPEAAPADESAVQESVPAVPAEESEESTAASPAYVIEDPNAQVRTAVSTLPAWTGPHYAEPHHDVYYPPEAVAAAEAVPPVAAALPPAAKVYFDTAKWDLPADAGEVLAPIVRYLQEHPQAKAVIQGFHDPRGSQELNAALAKNRAGATWAALVAAGVGRERIILRQSGDTTGSGSLAEARRAEVSVVGQ